MKFRNYLCLALIAHLIFSSCSIEKRHYRSGYHIDWRNKSEGNPTEISETKQCEKKDFTFSESVEIIPGKELVEPIIVSATEIQTIENSGTVSGIRKSTSDVVVSNPDVPKITEQSEKQMHSINPFASRKNITETTGKKNQIVALLLCIFLGVLGIHRFYLGYTGMGLLYLFTLGLFGVGWIIDIILLIIPNGLSPKGQDSYKE